MRGFFRWVWRRGWRYALVAAGAGLAGFIWRGFLGPFVMDDPFWRAFWTGAPAAGVLALGGAFVAFIAALISARTSRVSALRDEWWDRAEWALGHVMSKDATTVNVGVAALEVLATQATPTEGDMIAAVTRRRFLNVTPTKRRRQRKSRDGQ